jgi:acetyl-CoA carboxylase, biotin carboxyl carrier protein
MNYEELIELINHLDQSSLAFMDYQTDNEHLILSKEVPQMALQQVDTKTTEAAQQTNAPVETPVVQEAALEEPSVSEAIKETEEKAGEVVESPMVGVIYLQSHPDEDPYVKVGDRVEQGDVICIVEAMKLMNEIQAPHSGVVTEILVENEDVVEYKQPLIRID